MKPLFFFLRSMQLFYVAYVAVVMPVTMTVIIYYHLKTKQIKMTTHVIFDESNFTLPENDRSTAPNTLINSRQIKEGLSNHKQTHVNPPQAHSNSNEIHSSIQICMISLNSKVPTQATQQSIDYDLYFPTNHLLEPKAIKKNYTTGIFNKTTCATLCTNHATQWLSIQMHHIVWRYHWSGILSQPTLKLVPYV